MKQSMLCTTQYWRHNGGWVVSMLCDILQYFHPGVTACLCHTCEGLWVTLMSEHS